MFFHIKALTLSKSSRQNRDKKELRVLKNSTEDRAIPIWHKLYIAIPIATRGIKSPISQYVKQDK